MKRAYEAPIEVQTEIGYHVSEYDAIYSVISNWSHTNIGFYRDENRVFNLEYYDFFFGYDEVIYVYLDDPMQSITLWIVFVGWIAFPDPVDMKIPSGTSILEHLHELLSIVGFELVAAYLNEELTIPLEIELVATETMTIWIIVEEPPMLQITIIYEGEPLELVLLEFMFEDGIFTVQGVYDFLSNDLGNNFVLYLDEDFTEEFVVIPSNKFTLYIKFNVEW